MILLCYRTFDTLLSIFTLPLLCSESSCCDQLNWSMRFQLDALIWGFFHSLYLFYTLKLFGNSFENWSFLWRCSGILSDRHLNWNHYSIPMHEWNSDLCNIGAFWLKINLWFARLNFSNIYASCVRFGIFDKLDWEDYRRFDLTQNASKCINQRNNWQLPWKPAM